MLILTRESVSQAIRMKEAIEAARAAYRDCATGDAVVPERITIDMPRRNGTTAILPSHMARMGVFGAKLVSTFFDNPRLGLPTVNGIVVLQDGATGEVLAILEGNLLTAIKTGAATGVATDLLAREGARSVGLIGAGYQAPRQLEAVCEVRPTIREIRVFDIDGERAQGFAKDMRAFLGRFEARIVAAASAREAIQGADIVITATTSKTPVFDGRWLGAGAHVNAVGAFMPQMQEIDETALERADKIVTDTRGDALAMSGDFVQPMREGRFAASDIHAEVGEIVAGRKAGRESEDEITLFESIGLSALDVAVAKAAFENAVEKGLGTSVDLAGLGWSTGGGR